MSNWIYCTLDVLAGSGEIDQIHERLVRPSLDLVNWVAESNHQPVDEVTGWLKKLLHFQLIQRFDSDFIGYSDFLNLDLTDDTYRPIVDSTSTKFQKRIRKQFSCSTTARIRVSTKKKLSGREKWCERLSVEGRRLQDNIGCRSISSSLLGLSMRVASTNSAACGIRG